MAQLPRLQDWARSWASPRSASKEGHPRADPPRRPRVGRYPAGGSSCCRGEGDDRIPEHRAAAAQRPAGVRAVRLLCGLLLIDLRALLLLVQGRPAEAVALRLPASSGDAASAAVGSLGAKDEHPQREGTCPARRKYARGVCKWPCTIFGDERAAETKPMTMRCASTCVTVPVLLLLF